MPARIEDRPRIASNAASEDARVARLRTLHPRRTPRTPRPKPLGGAAKRAFDIIGASAALLFLSPCLLTIAAVIRLDSAGPIFFLQRRGGFAGAAFLIYKFRTMTALDDGSDI